MIDPAGSTPLEKFLWHNRLLVVFAQNDAPRLDRQRRMLDAAGNESRDLLVVEVPLEGPVRVAGSPPLDAAAVRKAYAIGKSAPFTVLLVGKDGGVKLRSGEPIGSEELFGTIDAMPMRQRESKGG